jgi:MarR family transcriptional regulator, organic hydroperoxide resistance regulator
VPGKPASREGAEPSLPLERSVGYQIRTTHRLVQRALQVRLERSGVTLGMWYFLRVLWDGDGLTQRQLSRRIGTMEPTTLSAISAMEAGGIVRRERDSSDRRKIRIYLTEKGRRLKRDLLPSAIEVVQTATRRLAREQVDALLATLAIVQETLRDDLAEREGASDGADPD